MECLLRNEPGIAEAVDKVLRGRAHRSEDELLGRRMEASDRAATQPRQPSRSGHGRTAIQTMAHAKQREDEPGRSHPACLRIFA